MRKIVLALAAAGCGPDRRGACRGAIFAAALRQCYGYKNNWGQVRSLQARIDAVQRQISCSTAAIAFATEGRTACAVKPTRSSAACIGRALTA